MSACLSISFFLNVAPVESILDLGSKDLSLHIVAHVNLARATLSGPHGAISEGALLNSEALREDQRTEDMQNPWSVLTWLSIQMVWHLSETSDVECSPGWHAKSRDP